MFLDAFRQFFVFAVTRDLRQPRKQVNLLLNYVDHLGGGLSGGTILQNVDKSVQQEREKDYRKQKNCQSEKLLRVT